MISALIGGVLVALAFAFVILLKRRAEREPRPAWLRIEAIESLVAIGIVSMVALGGAMVIGTAGNWPAFGAGMAVALGGSLLVFVATRRGRAAAPAPAQPA